MPRSANAFTTSALWSAMRLFTWQVMHHAAVKSTNTGLPCAVSSRTFSGDHGSHASSPARAALPGAPGGGAGHASATPATTKRIATTGRHRPSWCQRPYLQATMATSPSPSSSANTASLPCCEPSTETSHATVA